MVKSNQKDVRILVDSLRDPRDMAELVHLVMATNRKVDITGNSIRHDHPKVSGSIDSWKPGFRKNPSLPHVKYSADFFNKITELKKQGYSVVGTSSNFGESLFKTNLSMGKHVIVFGSESGGLSKSKVAVMDKIVRVPMENATRFYTLKTVIPVIVHEVMRQKGFFGKPKTKIKQRMPKRRVFPKRLLRRIR